MCTHLSTCIPSNEHKHIFMRMFLLTIHTYIQFSEYVINVRLQCDFMKYLFITSTHSTITHRSFHISSKLDFFIGVEMVMRHALICVKELFRSPLMTFILILMMYSNFSVTVYGAHDHVHIFSDFRLVNVY